MERKSFKNFTKAGSLIFLVVILTMEAWGQIPPTLIKKVQPAVVTIVTYDAQGQEKGLGSGFFINEKGHLITNFHVLLGAYKAKARNCLGKNYDIKQILAEDRLGDLVMASVEIPETSRLTVATVIPKLGEHVIVVGSPSGLEQTISDGVISSFRDDQLLGGKRIQITAPISPGSSGGPVVNLNGDVIGVACAYLSGAQNINFAVPGEKILALKPLRPQTLSEWTTSLTREWLNTADGKYYIALQYYRSGDVQKSISYFEEAAKKAPNNALPWIAIGAIYYGQGRGEDAAKALEHGLQIDPKIGLAHITLGMTYAKLDRPSEAVEAYKRGIQQGNLGPLLPNAYFLMGLAYSHPKLNRLQDSAEAYEKGIQLEPNSPKVILQLARTYAILGRWDKASDAFKRAVWLDPSMSEAHFYLGLYYLAKQDKQSAIIEINKLKGLDPKKADELESYINKPLSNLPF